MRARIRQMMQKDVGGNRRGFERARVIGVALSRHLGLAWDGHGLI